MTIQIVYQTLNGVAYCHSQGAVHRDIKPENILLTAQGQVKLCDFGFARMLSPGENYTDYVGESRSVHIQNCIDCLSYKIKIFTKISNCDHMENPFFSVLTTPIHPS